MKRDYNIYKRKKRCKACHHLFRPDLRLTGRQQYCGREACQNKRQRNNENDWRKRHPECVAYQYEQSSKWYKAHPQYSRNRRDNNPNLKRYNRTETRKRMRELRQQRLFDKSKSILTQLTVNKGDKCYLSKGSSWLHVRLTKASRYTRWGFLRDNRAQLVQTVNRLPQGRLYEVSREIFNQTGASP